MSTSSRSAASSSAPFESSSSSLLKLNSERYAFCACSRQRRMSRRQRWAWSWKSFVAASTPSSPIPCSSRLKRSQPPRESHRPPRSSEAEGGMSGSPPMARAYLRKRGVSGEQSSRAQHTRRSTMAKLSVCWTIWLGTKPVRAASAASPTSPLTLRALMSRSNGVCTSRSTSCDASYRSRLKGVSTA